MAKWDTMEADAAAESAGASKGNKFPVAPRGIYTVQVADYKDGTTKTGKPMVSLTCEIADGPEMGKRAGFVNVVRIAKGEKGHGIMVHQLHSFGLEHDGKISLDTSDFQGQTAQALVGVEQFEKVVNGKTYINERNFIEELYSAGHPAPKELPVPKVQKAVAGNPAAKDPLEEEVMF